MEDLEGWEVLPDDGFLEIHDDGGKKIFSRKYGAAGSNNVFKNYFICPSPKSSSQFVESTTEHTSPRVPKQLVTLPIQLEPPVHKPPPDHQEITKVPIHINITPLAMVEKMKDPNMGTKEADQDQVSQVFFKKMKETEFVDMKMDSPKSNSRGGIKHQSDAGSLQFEEKVEPFMGEALESRVSPPRFNKGDKEKMIKKINMDSDGFNIWKWSFTGIGAICSFGVAAAAATVCIFIFGSHRTNKQHPENQKVQFHIYSEDKRFKQVVHHATKLNEAISAVRGVAPTRAHITFGGYCDGL